MSLNDSMVIARSGILTHQTTLQVIGNNIANVNTPGYHRRIASLATNPSMDPSRGDTREYSLGSGVTISDVIRTHIDMQETLLRQELGDTEYHDLKGSALADMEVLLAGTDGASLTDHLQQFWNAWQDVANNADSTAFRGVLLETAVSLTEHINYTEDNLTSLRTGVLGGVSPAFTGAIADDVDKINSIADEIKNINYRISQSQNQYSAHDLMDRRDILVNELSKKVNVNVASDYSLTIDGQTLVSADGLTRNDLVITGTGTPPVFEINATVIDVSGSGALGAWSDMTSEIENFAADLDNLANTLITEVNALHTTGYDLDANLGVNFFNGTDAGNITVNITDSRLIAAASTTYAPGIPNPGDGSAALQIAKLTNQTFATTNNQTLGEFYGNTLATLGTQIAAEQNMAANGESSINMLTQMIQSETGVNLDEEMNNMLSTQRAYEASARMFQTLDGLLDLIINRM